MRRGAMLHLVLTKKESLLRNEKFKGSHVCSDHEMVVLGQEGDLVTQQGNYPGTQDSRF